MAASNEYTVWHLTSDGWVAGDTKLDNVPLFEKGRPGGTIASCEYYEYVKEMSGPMERSLRVTYIRDDISAKALVSLICRVGCCPEELNIHLT